MVAGFFLRYPEHPPAAGNRQRAARYAKKARRIFREPMRKAGLLSWSLIEEFEASGISCRPQNNLGQ